MQPFLEKDNLLEVFDSLKIKYTILPSIPEMDPILTPTMQVQ